MSTSISRIPTTPPFSKEYIRVNAWASMTQGSPGRVMEALLEMGLDGAYHGADSKGMSSTNVSSYSPAVGPLGFGSGS